MYNLGLNCGPSTGTAQQKQAYKDWAEDWMKKLKTEFYDNANPLGRQGMYLVLKRKHPGDNQYPTKRFVGAWLPSLFCKLSGWLWSASEARCCCRLGCCQRCATAYPVAPNPLGR